MKNWYIIYKDNLEAAKAVFAAVSRYTVVSCMKEEALTEEIRKNGCLIYVGIDGMMEIPENGYRIKVSKNEYGNEIVLLHGDGYVNVLYAAVDFENKYLVKAENADVHDPVYFFNKLFEDDMPDYDESFVPYIRNRALWSWGYVLFDYKGYLDNMLKLKLNTLILWNDYPPENAAELVAYAHKKGIRIIWGFSWGWSQTCTQTDISDLDRMTEEVLTKFERDYANLDGDGIYFQTFTETSEEIIGGKVIADAVVTLVNQTAEKLLERYPGLEIQFGLHATSVKDKLEYIKNTDPRVMIVWEDCGTFPYTYIPKMSGDFLETVQFTDKIKNLRGAEDGILLKGMSVLDWTTFKHQPGPYIIGEYGKAYIEKRTAEKRKLWKYLQAYWISNAGYAKQIVERMSPDNLVAALVEDGMFDVNVWYPVALYAEILWNPHRKIEDIMTETALMPCVVFA